MRIVLGHTIDRVEFDGRRFTVEIGAEQVMTDRLLIATGRRPSTAGMNLESIAVKLSAHGAIVVDEHMRTSVDGDLRRRRLHHAAAVRLRRGGSGHPCRGQHDRRRRGAGSRCYVHFFRSPEAASTWLAQHPQAILLSLAEAYEVGRRRSRARYGALLELPDLLVRKSADA